MKLIKTPFFRGGGELPVLLTEKAAILAAMVAAMTVVATTAHATSTTVASTNLNGVLVVERGDSFEVTGNMSIATTSGATGIVTNCGTMTVKELDLGKYSAAKGKLAQVDNYGTLTIGTHLRMGILGTPSVFYNHEGATVNKIGGESWTFYFDVAGGDSTLVNEGTFASHASDQMWMGLSSIGNSDIIQNKNAQFTTGYYVKMGHSGSSTSRIFLNDTSRMSGATKWDLGVTSGCKAYVTISNQASLVQQSYSGRPFNLGAASKALGALSLNDSATAEFANQLNVGAGAGAVGEITLNNQSALTALGATYVGNASSTGTVVLADSSVLTNRGGAFVVGMGAKGKGSLVVKDSARFINPSTAYAGHGNDSNYGSEGYYSFEGSSIGEFGHYLHVGSGISSYGEVTIKDNASVGMVTRELELGSNLAATGVLTVAGSARLNVLGDTKFSIGSSVRAVGRAVMKDDSRVVSSNLLVGAGSPSYGELTLKDNAAIEVQDEMHVGAGESSTGLVTIAGNAWLALTGTSSGKSSLLRIGYAKNATGYMVLTNDSTLVASNILVGTTYSSVNGTLEVNEGCVVSNVYQLQLGDYSSKFGQLSMRGGTILFRSGQNSNSTVIWLNPSLSTLKAAIRGWGKLAFENPRAMVTEMKTDDPGPYEKPGGITHYGQIVADGEGQMRDLDCGRLGVLNYDNTTPNQNGSTNGWFAVNKGRLKLPRSLPRQNASHHCVGDYWAVRSGLTGRLMNTFIYTLEGAETNNYMFAELYATDRDDIPAGLGEVGMDKTVAVWRIGHFSDGPEVEEPEHPAAFTSASIRFRYCPNGIEDFKSVYVLRHDGTADGKWQKIGRADPSTNNPVVVSKSFTPSSENWNMGWFAIAGRINPYGTAVILR